MVVATKAVLLWLSFTPLTTQKLSCQWCNSCRLNWTLRKTRGLLGSGIVLVGSEIFQQENLLKRVCKVVWCILFLKLDEVLWAELGCLKHFTTQLLNLVGLQDQGMQLLGSSFCNHGVNVSESRSSKLAFACQRTDLCRCSFSNVPLG